MNAVLDAPSLTQGLQGLLSVLETLLPLRFSDADSASGMAEIRIKPLTAETRVAAEAAQCPTLYLPLPQTPAAAPVAQSNRIRFADDPDVPWPYRNRVVEAPFGVLAAEPSSQIEADEKILATDTDGRVLWSIRQTQGQPQYRTWIIPPHVPADADAGIAATGIHFVQVLPLFAFFRRCCGDRGFANPPLRAAFIIDDPNLHWPSYGYANYREIANDAARHHYHVAFATIPLDAWWVDGRTARIFREHAARLSLLIHGNNHAKRELAQRYSNTAAAGLLQQATRRIQRLEAKSGVDVARVMVPPHGASSAAMLAELPRQGFESACISAGSLRAHNPGAQAWTRQLGFAPSESVRGCPVLPRWAFADANDATLLAAAYLGQAIVLRGHHQDLKQGLEILRELAARINAIGDVTWTGLGDLSRMNYRQRAAGDTLWIQPLGRRLRVRIPAGIAALTLEAETNDWAPLEAGSRCRLDDHGRLVLTVAGDDQCELAIRTAASPSLPLGRTGGELILRRILTEARDRLRLG